MGIAEHCQTCKERAVRWNPLRIRDWRIVLPNEQYLNEDVGEGKVQVNFRNELKELIGRVLKHLPGEHDQLTHGDRPHYGNVLGEFREMMLTSNPERNKIYQLEDASNLPTCMIAFGIKSKKGKILMSENTTFSHNKMIHQLDPQDTVDNYVRFVFRANHLFADIAGAGLPIDRNFDIDKALKNIYRGIDKLSSMGLPSGIRVTIDNPGDPSIETTTKEKIWKVMLKHLPGQHDQELHGNRDLNKYSRELVKKLHEKYPDESDEAIRMVERVMALDEKHFRSYAEKMGLDVSDEFIKKYIENEKEVDRQRLVKQLNEKYAMAYKRKVAPDYDKWEGPDIEKMNGIDVRDAQNQCDKLGIYTRIEPGMNEDDCNKSLSTFVNLAQQHPVVKSLVEKGAIKKVVFETSKTSTAAANANMPETITVLQPRYSGTPVYLHELGHLAREFYNLDLPYDIFSTGKTLTTYKTLDPEEQFADWFGFIAGEIDIPKIKAWKPEAFNYMIDNVPELKAFVEGAK
jgi:hypothetical protein